MMDKPRFLTKRGFFLCIGACQKVRVQKVRVQKVPGGGAVIFWAVPPCVVLCAALCGLVCGPVWSCMGSCLGSCSEPCVVLWHEFCVKHMVYAKRTGTGSGIMTSMVCSGPVGRAVGPCVVLWRGFCVKHMVYAKRTGTGSGIMTSMVCSSPVGRAVDHVQDLWVSLGPVCGALSQARGMGPNGGGLVYMAYTACLDRWRPL
jgi:hypothetical protein